jgi:hypothetical protein
MQGAEFNVKRSGFRAQGLGFSVRTAERCCIAGRQRRQKGDGGGGRGGGAAKPPPWWPQGAVPSRAFEARGWGNVEVLRSPPSAPSAIEPNREGFWWGGFPSLFLSSLP